MSKVKCNKILFSFMLILIFIFFTNCGINDALSNDEAKSVDEKSFEIGPSGGAISIDGISITIPSGAFEQTVNIKVTQSNDNITDGDIVTPIYSIEGLPDNYYLPIDVKIKLTDSTSNETYLVVQEESYIPSLDSIAPSSIYFDATVSGDSIEGQIPALTEGLAKHASTDDSWNYEMKLMALSHQKHHISSSNQFNIFYNSTKDNISNIISLGQYLENAYNIIKNIGFSYSRRDIWPVDVYIEDLSSNIYGYFKSSHYGLNSDYMRFNRINLSKITELKVTAVHEFFHLAQSLKDPRTTYNRAGYPSPYLWFNEACSVWSEDLVSAPGYISYVKDNNTVKQPFLGLANNLDTPDDATYHGYGMSAFVKYLVTKYGKNILAKIYEKLFASNNVVDAINNSINNNLFIEYTPFLEQYAQGKIYTDCQYDILTLNREGLFRIMNDLDTLKIFNTNYKDLSAKLFVIEPENPNLLDNATLELNTDQDLCDISVFSFPKSGGDVELINKGKKNCIVQNFKELTQQGKYLIAMVTNPNFIYNNYTPSNLDINLEMHVKIHKTIGVEIYIDIDGATYREKTDDGDWVNKPNESFIFTPTSGINGPKLGSINNNIFSSPLDNVYNPLEVESSNMTITFLDYPKRINIECELVINDNNTGIQEHRKFTIDGIHEEDTDHYWEYGTSLSRASITDTYYRKDYTGEFTSELVSVSPSDNAKVEVIIR